MRFSTLTPAITAVVLVTAACGSTQKVSTITVTQPASGAASSGVNASTPTTQGPISTSANGNKLMAEVKMGTPVKDDGVSFNVLSAKAVPSIHVPYGNPVRPLAGARLILVKVKTKNLGSVAVEPFCGDAGAVLGDPKHRNWQVNSDQTISIENTNTPGTCDELQPGLPAVISLVFDVPKNADITYIALWNGDPSGSDPDGQTYVDVNLS